MAETIEADNESWDEIKVTTQFTGGLVVVLIAVFEIARRNPAVAAVFDRRRGTHAHRTPPPLLRNSILEWLFLSNTDGYKEYAFLSHMRDVISERRRQKRRLEVLKERDVRKNESWMEEPAQSTDNYDSKPDEDIVHEDNFDKNTKTEQRKTSSNYQVLRMATKLTHYLTPDAVEFNGRRLPAEIAEYAMAGDLSERQLNEYEQRLLNLEKEEEEHFNLLRERMIIKDTVALNLGGVDLESQLDNSSISIDDDKDNLTLPPRKSRLRFIGLQQGKVKKRKNYNPHSTTLTPTNIIKPGSPNQETFRHIWEKSKSKFFSSKNVRDQSSSSPASPPVSPATSHSTQPLIHNQDTSVEVIDLDVRVNHHVNRHLKSTSISETRPLTSSDREMLRCIGLDYFIMIRFLRFCFDVSFYPFLVSCITLVPTYYTNQYDGINDTNENVVINEQINGYFRFTINRLEPSSNKLWITCGFAFFFYCFVLRRLWIEWETFICLRFEFLTNGDADYEEALAAAARPNDYKKKRHTVPKKDDVHLHLEQFRNSCIVEYIPESHRRDQELFQFFDSVFPGQVKRAEILINTPTLSDLMNSRQEAIELYEQFYAKHNHDKQKYSQKTDGYLGRNEDDMFCDSCCGCNTLQKPLDPTMNDPSDSDSWLHKCCCCCGLIGGGTKVKALPHLSAEIKKLNREVEKEYLKIVEEKQGVEDRDSPMFQGILDAKVAGAKTFLTGVGEELTCSTGFVEFTNLTAKQSALQCNLTGTTGYMVTTSAPDPRDVVWENATVEFKTTYIKKIQFDGLLFTGTLFWSVVVSAVTSVSDLDLISQYLPAALVPKEGSFWDNLFQGTLPVLLLEFLMIFVPIILELIARRFIRFKTNSEIDRFVFKWHLAYLIANLIIIIVKNQILKTMDLIRTNPQAAMDSLATGIALSSQFFLNNMIVATGTELLFELSQIPKMLYHFVLHKFITVEATSKRVLDELKVPESMDWGGTIPPFIFGLLIAIVYCTIVPIVTGVCAVYFYLATKVYTHQSLFVYAQPYEGGGMIMYQLNRSVFVIIYISVLIFSILFGLKKGQMSGLAFGIVMITITVLVDMKIGKDFVKPSISLALTNARIIDEENARRQELSCRYQEYKASKRARKRREAKDNLAKSVSTLDGNFKHDIDGNMNLHGEIEDEVQTYVPSSLRATKSINNSSAPSSSSPSVRFRKPESRKSSHVRKPAPFTLDLRNKSAESCDDEDFYLYRQPQLNKALWETNPRPYWY